MNQMALHIYATLVKMALLSHLPLGGSQTTNQHHLTSDKVPHIIKMRGLLIFEAHEKKTVPCVRFQLHLYPVSASHGTLALGLVSHNQ